MHRDYPLGVAQHSAGSVMLDLASDAPIHTEWWRTLSQIGGDVFANAVCAAADQTKDPVESIEALVACARLGDMGEKIVLRIARDDQERVVSRVMWALVRTMGPRAAEAFFVHSAVPASMP